MSYSRYSLVTAIVFATTSPCRLLRSSVARTILRRQNASRGARCVVSQLAGMPVRASFQPSSSAWSNPSRQLEHSAHCVASQPKGSATATATTAKCLPNSTRRLCRLQQQQNASQVRATAAIPRHVLVDKVFLRCPLLRYLSTRIFSNPITSCLHLVRD